MNWRLKSTENILSALLRNHMDSIACEFSHNYLDNADKELLLFCINNQNETFLKHAFQT